MQAIQIQAINDIIHWITLKIPCFDFAYLVSKQTLLFLRRFYISLKKSIIRSKSKVWESRLCSGSRCCSFCNSGRRCRWWHYNWYWLCCGILTCVLWSRRRITWWTKCDWLDSWISCGWGISRSVLLICRSERCWCLLRSQNFPFRRPKIIVLIKKNKWNFETEPVEVKSVVVMPMLTTPDTLVCLTVYFFSNFDSKISNFDYFSTFHQNCNSILVTLIIFG